MKKYIMLFLMVPGIGLAQGSDAGTRMDTLSLEQCVQIALRHNPQIAVSQGTLESSEAQETLTRSVLFPQISGSAGVTRTGGTSVFGSFVVSRSFNVYTAGFQANQMVFDFGRTYSRIAESADLAHASRQDLRGTEQNVIVNTYTAYYNYLAAQRVREVDTETVVEAEEHLRQAQGFFKAGTAPQYDVVDAEVTVANANVSLIQADNNIKIARIQMENVLGVPLPKNFALKDILGVSHAPISMEDAIQTAIKSRPELLSSMAQVQAGKAGLTAAWTANLPSINLSGGYNWRGFDIAPLYSGWSLGLTVSLPIFEGFALDAGIDQAKANLKIAKASNNLAMQSLYLTVQQDEYSLEEAAQKIQAAKKLVQQAAEALRLAVGEYNSGTGSELQVTDAQVSLANARITYIQSLYDYNVGYAQLERDMGVIK